MLDEKGKMIWVVDFGSGQLQLDPPIIRPKILLNSGSGQQQPDPPTLPSNMLPEKASFGQKTNYTGFSIPKFSACIHNDHVEV